MNQIAKVTPNYTIQYDAAIAAIAAALRIDEVKMINDKMVAIEAYARQSKNVELEIQACEIRLRATRRLGELLKETNKVGRRPKETASVSGEQPSSPTRVNPRRRTLAESGLTYDQSAVSQKLADVPAEVFETEVHKPGASAKRIVAAASGPKPEPRMSNSPESNAALWVRSAFRGWGREGAYKFRFEDLIAASPDLFKDEMRADAAQLVAWLEGKA